MAGLENFSLRRYTTDLTLIGPITFPEKAESKGKRKEEKDGT